MWEGRSKDRREKSKHTEWECRDRSWDNLLIWFPSRSGKQLTAGWICSVITQVPCAGSPAPATCRRPPLTALPASIPSQRGFSHPGELSPAGCPAFCSVGALGVTVTLHPALAVSPCLPSVWKPGWGNVSPSPAGLVQKGKGNCFSRQPPSPRLLTGISLWTPWSQAEGTHGNVGEEGGGAGQVRARGKAVRRRQGLAFVPFSPNLWEIMSLPAAIITDYMPFACCIKAACLINIILKGGLGMRETSCFELQQTHLVCDHCKRLLQPFCGEQTGSTMS